MIMNELTIICTKYGRYSQMIIRQEDEFSKYDRDLLWESALRFWDCDDIHLNTKPTVKVDIKPV